MRPEVTAKAEFTDFRNHMPPAFSKVVVEEAALPGCHSVDHQDDRVLGVVQHAECEFGAIIAHDSDHSVPPGGFGMPSI